MKSFQAFTDEIDNLDLAVDELALQIENFDLSPNTGGILFCGSEVNTHELCEKLRNRFHLPFIGTTCLGQFTSHGYAEASICLNLYTGEDLCFSGGVSGDLTSENMANELIESYQALKKAMSQPEAAIIIYTPWLPNVIYDDILDALTKASGGIPIFGGICSDNWEMNNCHAMCSMGSFTNRAAILLVGGNFHPKFSVDFSINWSSESSVTVTKSKGSTAYEFDNQRATDYLKSIGLVFPQPDVFVDCLASPMIFTYTTPEGNKLRTLRNLLLVNEEDGSVSFAGGIVEGAQMSMALSSRITIQQSIKNVPRKLFDEMNQDLSNYSGILVSSCTGRYCLTVANKNTECSALLETFGDKLVIAGGYLNGEFCPRFDEKTGKYINLLNNETFTLMAF